MTELHICRTATNVYLMNLAMADLAILVLALPNELYHLWQHYPWRLGHLACDIKAEWATLIGPVPSRYCALIG